MTENRKPWDDYVRSEWLAQVSEEVIAPDLEIIDSHHHLMAWPIHYDIGQTLEDFTGHRVQATIHVEAHGHYKEGGPEHLRSVGETQYIVEQARDVPPKAPRIAAGIVAHVDVLCGRDIDEILAAHAEAAEGRLRGIRVNLYWTMHADKPWTPSAVRQLTGHKLVAAALDRLGKRGLTCDLVAFHPNLDDVALTAATYPDTVFIVNHMGAPFDPPGGADPQELRRDWRRGIQRIATQPNIRLKLGGCANPLLSRAMPEMAALLNNPSLPPSSLQLAAAYRPYVEYCIDQLGPDRCMFESNFPIDKAYTSYGVLWNAYKRLVTHHSLDEQRGLLGGVAATTYRV
jgi:L-fuconolactonase